MNEQVSKTRRVASWIASVAVLLAALLFAAVIPTARGQRGRDTEVVSRTTGNARSRAPLPNAFSTSR